MGVSPNESSADVSEQFPRKRTIAMDGLDTQSGPSFSKKPLRRYTTRRITETVVSERVPKRANSRSSIQRQMTHPYLTFTPTIGRNSVSQLRPRFDGSIFMGLVRKNVMNLEE